MLENLNHGWIYQVESSNHQNDSAVENLVTIESSPGKESRGSPLPNLPEIARNIENISGISLAKPLLSGCHESVQPLHTTGPIEPLSPTEPLVPLRPTEPIVLLRSTEPVVPLRPAEASQPFQPFTAIQPNRPTKSRPYLLSHPDDEKSFSDDVSYFSGEDQIRPRNLFRFSPNLPHASTNRPRSSPFLINFSPLPSSSLSPIREAPAPPPIKPAGQSTIQLEQYSAKAHSSVEHEEELRVSLRQEERSTPMSRQEHHASVSQNDRQISGLPHLSSHSGQSPLTAEPNDNAQYDRQTPGLPQLTTDPSCNAQYDRQISGLPQLTTQSCDNSQSGARGKALKPLQLKMEDIKVSSR